MTCENTQHLVDHEIASVIVWCIWWNFFWYKRKRLFEPWPI